MNTESVTPGDRRLLSVADLLVTLADTLVDDFDVVELMHQLTRATVELFDITAAGLLLRDQRGGLRVVASSSEEARVLELFQVQSDEGPCLNCISTGASVSVPDLRGVGGRWPRFTQAAIAGGFESVHAVPMRLRDEVVGGLNLFGPAGRTLSAEDARIAQALADVATIGILQQRSVHRAGLLAEQLQQALNSRIVIEQAKGLLAQHGGLDMATAFAQLRRYARDRNLLLSGVALSLVEGSLDPAAVVRPRA